MKKFFPAILLLFLYQNLSAQVYIEKQTRHRFAQMNFGMDVQTSFGGQTQYLNSQGQLANLDLPSLYRPRLIIGGTHFWGHADFNIAIPLANPTFSEANQDLFFTSGVETLFKYYPWRIEHHRLRPYVGFSFTSFFFSQDNQNFENALGPNVSRIQFPLVAGINFNHKNHLLELGFTYNYANRLDYYISPTLQVEIETPPIYAALSYRYMLETTLSAEQDWESGKTKAITDQLAAQGKLNGFFIGAGMSSAFWLGASTYNQSQRPYIPKFGVSLMPDFTAGYYWNNLDLNVAASFRRYQKSFNTYGVIQELSRQSLGIEVTKYIGDYHGFVPFIGPVLTRENIQFDETELRATTASEEENKMIAGITFGWDIRPNRLQGFILRTNLRYFPKINLKVAEDEYINFSNLEFNFIQVIIYPGRLF